ncbi:hypothetical protein ACSEQV_17545, partial [Pseudomonas aeruginosa]
KVICFIGKLGGWGRGILPNQKVFFRVSFTVQEMREFLTPAMTIAQKAQITGGLLTLFVAVWVFKKMRTSIPH